MSETGKAIDTVRVAIGVKLSAEAKEEAKVALDRVVDRLLDLVAMESKRVHVIRNQEQHSAALREIVTLMEMNPGKDSADGERLELLALVVQEYERVNFPLLEEHRRRVKRRVTEARPPKLTRNAAQCKLCEEIIESKHVHDYVSCKCGNVSVDGGLEYIRRAFKGDPNTFVDLSEPASYYQAQT